MTSPEPTSTEPTSRPLTLANQSIKSKPTCASGRWTTVVHQAFLDGLKKHHRDWKKFDKLIPTRSKEQIHRHAHRYFEMLAQGKQMKTIMDPRPSNPMDFVNDLHCRRCDNIPDDLAWEALSSS